MERLTIEELIEHCDRQLSRIPSGNKFYQEHESVRGYLQILRHYIATGLMAGRVAELAQAEKDGRMVVLPCKVGDKVWVILEGMGPCVARVQGISMSANCKDTILNFGGYPTAYAWGSGIGKTWFPTRQEAEAYMRKADDNV